MGILIEDDGKIAWMRMVVPYIVIIVIPGNGGTIVSDLNSPALPIIDDNCWKMFRNLYVDVDASTCIYDQDR